MYVSHFTLHEFEKTSHLPFILARKDTNVLNYLCEDEHAKVTITRSIVLSLRNRDKSFLPTSFHVNWAMECLGFAFSLHVEQYLIINHAIEIYRSWLNLGPKNMRPSCIEENEGFYQREIIAHLSLIFKDRPGETSQHAKLCVQVLRLLRDLVRNFNLEHQTWQTLLKTLMLISAPLYKNTTLAQELCPLLWKTVFEVWLRSDTREEELWSDLANAFTGWVNHTWFIFQWSSTCQGLTQRVLALLFASHTPLLTLEMMELPNPFKEPAEIITLNVGVEQTLFFWYRLLSLMLSSTADRVTADPMVYAELIKAVAKITDLCLAVSEEAAPTRRQSQSEKSQMRYSNTKETIQPELAEITQKIQHAHSEYAAGRSRSPLPLIDDLMALLGHWLFYHANIEGAYIEMGKAEAVSALCRIFCRGGKPIERAHLARFCKTIAKCVSTHNQIVIVNIFKFSRSLLCEDLPGIRALFVKEGLLRALADTLCRREAPVIKAPCYAILSSVIAIAPCYQRPELSSRIAETLTESLAIETSPRNFHVLVWSAVVFLSVLENRPELTEQLGQALVDHLAKVDFIQQGEMCQDLVHALASLPFLICHKTGISERLACYIIQKFCSYVPTAMGKAAGEKALRAVLVALLHWLECFPECFSNYSLRSEVIQAVLTTCKIDHIREDALYVRDYLVNHLGRAPPSIRYTPFDPLQLTAGYFSSKPVGLPVKHFYLGWESLLSVYDISEANPAHEEALLVVRNALGRHVWRSQLIYKETPSVIELPEWQLRLEPDPQPPRVPAEDPSIAAELGEILSSEERRQFESLRATMSSQQRTCAAHHAQSKQTALSLPEASAEPAKADAPKSHRLLLAHLGFFSTEQTKHIKAVHDKDIQNILQEFDNLSEKELVVVPVLYTANPEFEEADILSQEQFYSEDFQDFLPQLGVFVTPKHKDIALFRAVAPLACKYGGILYNTGYFFEAVYLSTSLLSEACTLKELVSKGNVVIVWNQRANDPYTFQVPVVTQTLNRKSVILLTPLRNRIVRVNILGTEDHGPLLNDMLVPCSLLGQLLLRTVLNMNKFLSARISGRMKRVELLQKIGNFGSKDEMIRQGKLNSLIANSFS